MARAATAVEQTPGSTLTLHRGRDGSVVKRTVLPGGLRIVTESVPTVRSVSFGMWVGVGSRDESVRQAGASHFLEHLLFKGTERRSALELSSEVDRLGGEMNAFTAKEYTCYYARVLDTDLPVAVDVLTDMVTSSVITDDDYEAERSVICEEIAMHDDDPADVVHDAFAHAVFGDSPLGRPILGSVGSIEALPGATVRRFYRRWYQPRHVVVAAAGNLDHAWVVRLVKKAFATAGVTLAGDDRPAPPRAAVGARRALRRSDDPQVLPRSTEQANLVLGMPGLSRSDDRRFALGVLNSALGGGMSSRLFQEIREKRGLAYSVYSYSSQYADTGLFGVYAGCLPKKVDDVVDLCRTELEAVATSGLTLEELERGKGQLRGSIVLGLEDTGSRMSRIGKSELVYGELLSVDEVLSRIQDVTLEAVRGVAASVLGARPTLAVIGPFDGSRRFGSVPA